MERPEEATMRKSGESFLARGKGKSRCSCRNEAGLSRRESVGFRTGIYERGEVRSHIPGMQQGPHTTAEPGKPCESLLNVVGGRQWEVLSRVTTCSVGYTFYEL